MDSSSNNQMCLSAVDSEKSTSPGIGFGLKCATNTSSTVPTADTRSTTAPPPPLYSQPYSFSTSLLNQDWTPFSSIMAKKARRLQTFEKWPKQMSQRPEHLVNSGFYYSGQGDSVTCFHCGITLKSWDAGDEIDFEHHRFSPKCKFLMMVCNNA